MRKRGVCFFVLSFLVLMSAHPLSSFAIDREDKSSRLPSLIPISGFMILALRVLSITSHLHEGKWNASKLAVMAVRRKEIQIRRLICVLRLKLVGYLAFLITSKVLDVRRRGATTEAYGVIRRKASGP